MHEPFTVAILGAGNGAHAMAGHLALKGFTVRLYNKFEEEIVQLREQGGVTAIPMWIGFMREALAGEPEHALARPPGIVEVRINPKTGLVASDLNPNAKWEIFDVRNIPEREPDTPFERRGTGIDVPITAGDEDIF